MASFVDGHRSQASKRNGRANEDKLVSSPLGLPQPRESRRIPILLHGQVFDEGIVLAERRWRKSLSSCADSRAAGHVGMARATGMPRRS